ncbi:hypothetical protein DPQ33_12180 [Oceanidesulfovibrio indonesiensis]|uniref:Uncharacterized protein n=1 Tax=Oceanidesulfovibrio indonesiensis TaxID=54767 RepID=A0A7M3MCY3_9BACT|nr:hypothetical protein [Oceanidesulfovibrio indonesiensis]TVM16374.1 hypothetical protein DPQ33_12180 [Oceanidesulfovibrio indonesiensis]
MSSINNINGFQGLNRPDLNTDQAQSKERAEREQEARAGQSETTDSVQVRNVMTPPSETLDEESAREAVRRIQAAGADELQAAHNGLDPERVYRLLGLLS